MIRVQVDLVPYGLFAPEAIGTLDIANTGEGTRDEATYKYRLVTTDGYTGRITRRPWRALPGTHRRDDGIWVLLAKVGADLKRRGIGRARSRRS